jgi:uncharacterized membrane protein YjgN (DUF898 family)
MDDISTIQPESRRLRLGHTATAGDLWPVVLKNAVLNILTLWFYRFWGKTNVRRLLWQKTTLNGEPLEYTGTGKELFIGFLIVFFVVLLPLYLSQQLLGVFAPQLGVGPVVAGSIAFYVVILFLIGVAIYRARRYRLTRTLWRGIRGNMAGTAKAYALRYLGFVVLNVVTFGLAYPFGRMRLFGRLMRETTFGDRQFSFEGAVWALYQRYLLLWVPVLLGMLVLGTEFGVGEAIRYGDPMTIAMYANTVNPAIMILPVIMVLYWMLAWAWYRAREIRHFTFCTRYSDLSFGLEATGWSLIRLTLGNLLIVLLTLGFGGPFTQMRVFRYVCDRLTIGGSIDIDAIVQSSDTAPSFGEGLADAFDMGAV